MQAIAAIALTPNGFRTLQRLPAYPSITLWVPSKLAPLIAPQKDKVNVYHTSLKDQITRSWAAHDAIIFVLSTGAVVRLIAPLLRNKETDPAILVMDDHGKHVISLCGGHQRGADKLAQSIALHLNGNAVLTGGSNGLGLPGVDVLGTPFGWTRGRGDWTGVSGAIARQEVVQVIQEAGNQLWQTHLPKPHPFQLGWPNTALQKTHEQPLDQTPTARLWISPIQRRFAETEGIPKAQWHPRVLWIGVGCERGTPREVIEYGIQQACQSTHFAEGAIAGLATIDLKADETGLVELCRDREWPLRCFPADLLRKVEVPTPSSIVNEEVGTPSVAEAAALIAAINPVSAFEEMCYCSFDDDSQQATQLQMTKRIFRLEGYPGAVTIAITQATQEYIGRPGRLWLVGTGPGAIHQMTSAAQEAIVQADVIIGYSLYIDLVTPLLRPGQIVERFPITQERQRADRAIHLSDWGLTVAVISSGDAGIYGMAGLVMESLSQLHWNGQMPEIEIFPGVSALQAAASRTGTPFMHDFCAISLSDLMTPWEVIEKRLKAAAQADFVVALYNPKSKKRTENIAIARSIFLTHKSPQTPVAIVRSAHRPDEQITISTLEHFLEISIDMLTIILIGNSSTQQYHNWLITPRGYLTPSSSSSSAEDSVTNNHDLAKFTKE
ncbi:MAG: precorrin-3B C(17)-methyltransferase [Cyanobacteria bacterium P01_E01_bin.6]